MQPIIANASFSILVLMPLGWLFMAATVALEIAAFSRLTVRRWWNRNLIAPVLVANLLSGAVGFFASYQLNRGWWLVVWLPWVSSNEVDLKSQLGAISVYYGAAFLATILVECATMHVWLRRRFGTATTLKATILTNVASYLIGSVAIYSWSFRLI